MVVKHQNHKREIAERKVYNPRKLCYRGCLQRDDTTKTTDQQNAGHKTKEPQKERLLAETHAHTNAHAYMHTATPCTLPHHAHAMHMPCTLLQVQIYMHTTMPIGDSLVAPTVTHILKTPERTRGQKTSTV